MNNVKSISTKAIVVLVFGILMAKCGYAPVTPVPALAKIMYEQSQ
jgi:hypothetical protein